MRHIAAFLYSTIIALFFTPVKRVYSLLQNYYLCATKKRSAANQHSSELSLHIPKKINIQFLTNYTILFRSGLAIILQSFLSLYPYGGIPPAYVYSISHLLSLVKCIYVLLRFYYLHKKSTALRRCSKRLFCCNFRC